MIQKKRVAVLISGRGSNMESLARACREDNYPADIVLVLSNRPQAPGLERARILGLSAHSLDHKAFPSRLAFEQALDSVLCEHGVELICNAGFMRLLTPWFVARWQGRQLNIHPSLLPDFKGLKTHERALEARVRRHGCSVHFVSEGMDEGRVVAQASLPVFSHDTPESLAARVLEAEHRLYPLCLKHLAEGRYDSSGQRGAG